MSQEPKPLIAAAAPTRRRASNYPEPFASRMRQRAKRPLGDSFGLDQFGVNFTELAPGGESALLHRHTRQQEFVFVLEGTITLITELAETQLRAGMCVGFHPAGGAHQLINRTAAPVRYLEIGSRIAGDEVIYPADDLKAGMGEDGQWQFSHKDGTPYAR